MFSCMFWCNREVCDENHVIRYIFPESNKYRKGVERRKSRKWIADRFEQSSGRVANGIFLSIDVDIGFEITASVH
jgi:hypothetical protein